MATPWSSCKFARFPGDHEQGMDLKKRLQDALGGNYFFDRKLGAVHKLTTAP